MTDSSLSIERSIEKRPKNIASFIFELWPKNKRKEETCTKETEGHEDNQYDEDWPTTFWLNAHIRPKILVLIFWYFCSFWWSFLSTLDAPTCSGFSIITASFDPFSPFRRWEDKHFLSWCHILKAYIQRLPQEVYQDQKESHLHHWIQTSCHCHCRWRSSNVHCLLSQYGQQHLGVYSWSVIQVRTAFPRVNQSCCLYFWGSTVLSREEG